MEIDEIVELGKESVRVFHKGLIEIWLEELEKIEKSLDEQGGRPLETGKLSAINGHLKKILESMEKQVNA